MRDDTSEKPRQHDVKEGDCISRIAFVHRDTIDRIWTDKLNESLAKARGSGYLLIPDQDIVYIPPPSPELFNRETDQQYRFELVTVKEKLKLQFLDSEGNPRKGLAYKIQVGEDKKEDKTGDQGEIELDISPEVLQGALTLDGQEFVLELGSMRPVSEMSGVVSRLVALGFLADETLASDPEVVKRAIQWFQVEYKTTAKDGTLDASTRAKLAELHGC